VEGEGKDGGQRVGLECGLPIPGRSGVDRTSGDGWPAGRPRSGAAGVAVITPVDLRDGHHTAERWRLHLAWPWTVVVERLIGTHGVVEGDVGTQEAGEDESHSEP
jgi:hypothetical protein